MSGVDQRANLTESFHISGLSSTKQYRRTMATKARRHEESKGFVTSRLRGNPQTGTDSAWTRH